jgi:hypothetical protein
VYGHLLEASCLWCSCRERLLQQLVHQLHKASIIIFAVRLINLVFDGLSEVKGQ